MRLYCPALRVFYFLVIFYLFVSYFFLLCYLSEGASGEVLGTPRALSFLLACLACCFFFLCFCFFCVLLASGASSTAWARLQERRSPRGLYFHLHFDWRLASCVL